jgi:hypothetical protein
MIKVGITKITPKDKKKRKATYSDVEFDDDGWADASKYLPENYDLVRFKTANATYNGWSRGRKWDGLRVEGQQEVLYWKRQVNV